MLPIRRAYLSTSNEVTYISTRHQFQFPSDRFNKTFRSICSLQDHGHYNQATNEARQLSSSNEQQRRLAQLLLSSLQLFSEGSVKKAVSSCAAVEPVVSRLLRQDCANIAPVDVCGQTAPLILFDSSSKSPAVSAHFFLVPDTG